MTSKGQIEGSGAGLLMGFQYLMVQLKADGKERRWRTYPPFQYLMVQLKESYENGIRIIIRISIPHGTIKSEHKILPTNVLSIFQYLMVQLKVSSDGNRGLRFLNFNTSWYN